MNTRRRRNRRPNRQPRRGTIALLFVGALLVALGAMALVVDRIWIDNASVELQSAADASALAAARSLAGDETLREEVDWQEITQRAREIAQRAATLNPVAGGSLHLRSGAEGDVWFGRDVLDRETGQEHFVFTDYEPRVVKVRAERTKDTSNPVGMMLGGMFGVPTANVSTFSSVVVDNHVLGIRAHEGQPVPALPFALLAKHEVPATSEEQDTAEGPTEQPPARECWATTIEAREGRDELGWDTERNELVRRPDGLPEIVVRPLPRVGGTEETEIANVHLLDFRSDFGFDVLERQVDRGLTTEHLAESDGEMLLDGRHHGMRCTAVVDDRVIDMLERVIGQPRLCFLYEHHESTGRFGEGTLDVTRLVAVRVLEIRRTAVGTEVVLQPTVVVTKTAIPFDDWQWRTDAGPNAHGFRNPYVYQLTVTR